MTQFEEAACKVLGAVLVVLIEKAYKNSKKKKRKK